MDLETSLPSFPIRFNISLRKLGILAVRSILSTVRRILSQEMIQDLTSPPPNSRFMQMK